MNIFVDTVTVVEISEVSCYYLCPHMHVILKEKKDVSLNAQTICKWIYNSLLRIVALKLQSTITDVAIILITVKDV